MQTRMFFVGATHVAITRHARGYRVAITKRNNDLRWVVVCRADTNCLHMVFTYIRLSL